MFYRIYLSVKKGLVNIAINIFKLNKYFKLCEPRENIHR